MHSFGPTDHDTFIVYFANSNQRETILFEVPTLVDACRAVSALNGGEGTFTVIGKRQGKDVQMTHMLSVPGH